MLFAHDYSLCNWSSFPNLQHLFVVGVDPGPLVSLPGIPWDGEFRSPTRTTVNLEKLGDLVEDIVEQLRELARGNQLEVDLKGGITELQKQILIRESGHSLRAGKGGNMARRGEGLVFEGQDLLAGFHTLGNPDPGWEVRSGEELHTRRRGKE